MAKKREITATGRISFGKIKNVIDYPDLLEIQLKSYKEFLQEDVPPSKRENKGLQAVFKANFPITDSKEIYVLDFIEYYLDKPKFTIEECKERGLTYAVPLKAKLRLSSKLDPSHADYVETIEQDVFLGNLPYMTERGTFIINGAERVVVNQLQRSPGVFFDETVFPNGLKTYQAQIIPLKGSWIEFTTDVTDMMYVYIDRKRKFYVTTLLRALGFSSDEEILKLFDLVEEIPVNSSTVSKLVGKVVATDVFDRKTGEIIITRNSEITANDIERVRAAGIKELLVWREEDSDMKDIILKTMDKDTIKSEKDAVEHIYKQLRLGEIQDAETARSIIEKWFFNPKRYDLSIVGRYKINSRLNLNVPLTEVTLTKDDIVAIIKYLVKLQSGKERIDDVDHLGNRRVRTVAEQLAQVLNAAFARLGRTIKERLNLREAEKITPQDLVNSRIIANALNAFFGTSQLSQFMDQTNPLAEITHKRRVSALGPGGLTRERAGIEVRDVHYTQYGRLCPIETPEGPNIGLIASLAVFARINEFGFIETPYRKVKNGRVTNEVEYLTADEEERVIIAQANAPIDSNGRFLVDKIKARKGGDFVVVSPEEVQYMDISPNQIVSVSASLIPFLEHDDANRALMGSNMQRQAVPLLRPEAPLVGTGFEDKVARDSRMVIVAEGDGVVKYVDATKIVVEYDHKKGSIEEILSFDDKYTVEYKLTKFARSNQDTCINQKPIVKVGQRVKAGDVLADGPAIDHGELALGRNVLVAFMPWRGYNFEDAIIVSEKLVAEDAFTSVHIEEFELSVHDTRRGEEEFTREIPNVSEEAIKDLDENGIVKVGTYVKEGDILIGKITPKAETEPTPEEKLLRAIFGEKAGEVKDASLRASPGLKGVVIATKLFQRKKKDAESKKQEKKLLDGIERKRKKLIAETKEKLAEKLGLLLEGETSLGIRNKKGEVVIRSGVSLKPEVFKSRIDELDELDYDAEWVESPKKNMLKKQLYENYLKKLQDIETQAKIERYKVQVDELQPGVVQLARVYVAKKRKLQVGDKMAGRHGNKGVIAKVAPVEDMPFLPDGTPVDIVLNPLGVPSRMNLGQLFETALGWAAKKLGVKYASPIFDGATWEDIQEELRKAGLPETGKIRLYDGRTGEPFDQEVTVGYIYMMKLIHMVEDKIHARSIGPYSLITQQPLGGKAQFGGQRLGEMEVWALEAYGAAYTLQEMLTYKSDDIQGRSKAYEAIVKGDNLPEPGIPESFNVLVRELQGLGLDVRIE
ncbi:DNA-directed RNA polymerase subunit beta [Candidatus Kryptonium thompsonii]|uniref:DNA-directed RNA polymerase subunit beta n=1 Tax=Candidatus Kryptonium thompsonii TaxID=1633631 RepID=UPI000707E33C|nr:DNA-directed RNA polymerase subunit beta [Candidatus Kryptonium thompsoni]CUS85054.1 DNA-directed RNA polymerase subunit beta [Candidatus Kryptonium thompsoni]